MTLLGTGMRGTLKPDLRPRLVAIDKLGGGWGNFTKQVTAGKISCVIGIGGLQSIE
jgi:hypothetical protein